MKTSIIYFWTVSSILLQFDVNCDVNRGSNVEGHVCQKFDERGLKHLATKSPYRLVANYDERPPTFEGCSSVKIGGVVRHGTRTPGVKDAQKIRSALGKLKREFATRFSNSDDPSAICPKERELILNWEFNVENEEGKILTSEGEDEMLKLGQRYQKRFPHLLPETYNNASFFFKYTRTQRTEYSALRFVEGLFGKRSLYVWFPEALDKDPILRFYKLCNRWKDEVKNNAASKHELDLYKTSNDALAMTKRISHRLGLNYTITYENANWIYLACAFEVAWHKERKSPWCSILSKEDFEVLEYGEELKYYWRDGYGFDVNYRQACVLTDNVFDFFESSGEPNRTSQFYFTHSGTILKLLSHLGLYKDPFKLTHDLSPKLKMSRKFKVSYIDAFGSNVVFVLYRCSDGDKVLTLHQERIVRVSGCPDTDLCPLTTLRHVLNNDDHSCQLSKICNVNDPNIHYHEL